MFLTLRYLMVHAPNYGMMLVRAMSSIVPFTKHPLTATILAPLAQVSNQTRPHSNHPNTLRKQKKKKKPLKAVIQTPQESNKIPLTSHPNTPESNKPNFQHQMSVGFTFVLHNCTFY